MSSKNKNQKKDNRYKTYRERLKQRGKYEEYLSKARERAKKNNPNKGIKYHNGYVKSNTCDRCNTPISGTNTGYLIIHHKYFQTCRECMPIHSSPYHGNGNSKIGICEKPGHRETLCIPCHRIRHRGSWDITKEIDKQNEILKRLREGD